MKRTSTRSKIFISMLALTVLFTCSCSFSTESGKDNMGATGDTNIVNNTVNITGTYENIAYAAASGLRSAVSVYCNFTARSGSTSSWNPIPTTKNYYSVGSGVIYKLENNGSAFIITNYHVVYDSASNTANHVSDRIYVYLYGRESEEYAIPATYVGGSANYDIAVLRVDKSQILLDAMSEGGAAAVTVADSDKVVPGQTTIAIGNPASDAVSGISVTKGIVSVDSEYIVMSASDNSGDVQFRVIRTDTAVNSGNSGGGLFDITGKLVGIVNAKVSDSKIENIGYAIPSNVVRAISDNIIDYCYGKECENVMRGILGITISSVDFTTSYNNESGILEKSEMIEVASLTSGGLGSSILKKGDIIKSISIGENTIAITRRHHIIDAMLDLRVGDTVVMKVIRDGEEITVSTVITKDCLVAY